MLCKLLLLAVTFQVGPFYEQRADDFAVRPFYAQSGETSDILWPLFTKHRDWWRFLFFVHYQENTRGNQFEVMPLFWRGKADDESYWGLFPIYGHHPHIALMYDIDFALWPVWMRYKMPRPKEKRMMTTNAVLWPFVHWRDDGSWGVWPFYVCNQRYDSFHQTALWPLVSWARYEQSRDSSGEGLSWMVWPLGGAVKRERETQYLFLPPLFSYAATTGGATRLRLPWPIFEYEYGPRRDRISIFPIYEYTKLKSYVGESESAFAHRFGWKLVEITDTETRVFPFWVSRPDDTYFRLWPFWESQVAADGVRYGRFLALFPIRHVPAVDRNWAKFWTFYEQAEHDDHSDHALFWGLIRWSTKK